MAGHIPPAFIKYRMFKSKRPQAVKIDKTRLSLEINGTAVYPGIDLHSSHWAGLRKSLKAKRLGIMEKKNLGVMWRETVYLIDNPVLSVFDKKLEFAPRIHQFEQPPAAHLADNLWRTGAFICFYGGVLFRWIAQVAGDSEAAELFYKRAENKAEAEFGPARKTENGLLWKTNHAEIMLNIGGSEAVLLLTHRPDRLAG